MSRKEIVVDAKESEILRQKLAQKQDPDSKRMTRFLSMPDLSRTPGNPLHEIVQRVMSVEGMKNLDVIEIPEIISTNILFDLFNMPSGHPARSTSDTYYVDPEHVLRTHDTVFWYYYLQDEGIKAKIAKQEPIGAACYGKVYRKDEIDRKHMNVFHQIGGLYLVPDSVRTITPDDLKKVLSDIGRSIFGQDTEFRFYEHTFPYTDPICEMEAWVNGQWMEMVGSGLARKSVLANFGLTGYNGWAFGFGMERLAMASMELPDIRLLWSDDPRVKNQLKLGTKYHDVSKYPQITRDVSFVVPKSFIANDYFDLIRDLGGDLVEEVKLLDTYTDANKFGDKISYTYHIVYRSMERTLTSEEVDAIQSKVYEATKSQFGAEIR